MEPDQHYTNQDPDLKPLVDISEHEKYAQGLIDLAAWIRAHPEVNLPSREINAYPEDTKENAALHLRALGSCRKDYSDSLMYMRKSFGPITLQYLFDRDTVCVRRVVGQKKVEACVIPERVIHEHMEDIVEWDCQPVLRTDNAE